MSDPLHDPAGDAPRDEPVRADAERPVDADADADADVDDLVGDLAAAWRGMAAPKPPSEVPVDASTAAVVDWLATAWTSLPAPAAASDDVVEDASTAAARAWMSAGWTHLPAPALPRGDGRAPVTALRASWRRVAAAAVLLVGFVLALHARRGTEPVASPTPAAAPGIVAHSTQPAGTESHASGASHASASASTPAGLPPSVRHGVSPLFAAADRIESRSGRVRFVLLTEPGPGTSRASPLDPR